MKAIDLLFQMSYGSLIYSKRLHGDRLKCWGMLVEAGPPQKHIKKYLSVGPQSEFFLSVESPECPLSDEVWQPGQFWHMSKWHTERFRQPLFSPLCSTVVFLPVFAWVGPISTNIPLHFGLSLCNLLEHIRLLYPIWKLRSLASIWPQIPKYFVTK